MSFIGRRLLANRAGNVALTFALLTPLLALLAGGAVDVTNASMRQSQLQQAADAAAVGAIARNSPGYTTALQMVTNGSVSDSVTLTNTRAIFNADWRSSPDTTITGFSGNADNSGTIVYKNGTQVDANVHVTGTFSPSFLGLLSFFGLPKMQTIQLTATSNAADNIPAYMTFYMLLDNTPSMGIAATPNDITTMVNKTSDQCAFACHDTSQPTGTDYYAKAQQWGVTTRIDNVAAAAANMLSTAQTTEKANGIANEFSVAIYDFGLQATDPTSASYTGYSQVFPQTGVSTDLASAKTAAAGITIMSVNGQGQYNDEDTNIDAPLNYAAQNLLASGSGSSSFAPKQVIFLVSDGTIDTYNCVKTANSTYVYNDGSSCRQITPIDTTPCTTLKKNGVEIAVLYTTYYPLTTNSFWQSYIQPWTNPTDQIGANMQACATPGFFFKVDSGGDINAAMQALFQKVVASVRITG